MGRHVLYQRLARISKIILGAGPTGLGAAMRLEGNRHADWQLLERSGHAGGLAASFTDKEGFTWDIGGHVQFSHTTGYSAMFLAGMLAIIYVIRGVFTRSMTQQSAQSLARMTYGVICFPPCWK